MRVTFKSNRLQKSMASQNAMERAYGNRAKRLNMRMTVLHEADNLDDVPKGPPDNCHQLDGDRAGCFAVHVTGNDRIVFEPDHEPVPRNEDGGFDLKQITAIRILAVEDYH